MHTMPPWQVMHMGDLQAQGPPVPGGWPRPAELDQPVAPQSDGTFKPAPDRAALLLAGLRAAIHPSPPASAWTGLVARGLALRLQAMGSAVDVLADRGRLPQPLYACDLLIRLRIAVAEPPRPGAVQIGYGLLQLGAGRRAARRLQQAIRATGVGDAEEGPCWLLFPMPRAPGAAVSLDVMWDGRRPVSGSPEQWAEALALGAATHLLDVSGRPWVGSAALPAGPPSGRDSAVGSASPIHVSLTEAGAGTSAPAERTAAPAGTLPAAGGAGQPAGVGAAEVSGSEPEGHADEPAPGGGGHGVAPGRPSAPAGEAGSEGAAAIPDPSGLEVPSRSVKEAESMRRLGGDRHSRSEDHTGGRAAPARPVADPASGRVLLVPVMTATGPSGASEGRLMLRRPVPEWYRSLLGPNATIVHIPDPNRRPAVSGQPAIVQTTAAMPRHSGTRVIRHR